MASKITIKRSLTAAAPAGLSFGEMAFVQGSGLTANQLYVGISGGNPVWVGAQIGTTGTWTDNAAKTSLATQFATDQRISSLITAAATGVSSVNGATGAVVNVALTTNSLSQFAPTTSVQLLDVISDETGTGSLVFATSPTLVTPALGTPSGGTLTNCTFPTLNQNTTGSAATLTTSRNINGILFNGSADITVTAAAGTLTGVTLNSTVLASSLTSVGILLDLTVQNEISGDINGSAASSLTAERLLTARSINGVTFDGSADITVTAAANTLTGATLASNVLASSLTSVGTLGSLSITGDLTVGGTFTVNGTVTTINSTTLTVDDKNIELGSVTTPSNDTADGGGITLKGATDKTLTWVNSGAFAWTSSENFDLVSTKAYYIAGASVLNATTLGSAIVTSSLTSVGTLTSLTVSGTLEAGLIDGGTF